MADTLRRSTACLFLLFFLVLAAVSPVRAQNVFVVDDTGDAVDAAPGDGTCATASAVCTLRAAIDEANATANVDGSTPDSIAFSINTSSVVNVGAAYPDVTESVVIDGTTAASGALPRLRIDGGTGDGFRITAGNSTLRGLQIVRFAGRGVVLTGGGGNVIEDCQIGDFLSAGSPAGYGNGGHGIHITGGSIQNQIGGTDAGIGNVVSGNGGNGITVTGGAVSGTNNVISGNYVGVAADGETDLGNTGHGILLEGETRRNTIGQSLPDAPGNVISGNGMSGVRIDGTFGDAASSNTSDNDVFNNRIGVSDAGDAAVPNDEHGVHVNGATGTDVGTYLPLPNVISGNGRNGVYVFGTDVTVRGNLIGTDAAGTTVLGNGPTHAGVILTGATAGVTIGGAQSLWRNVISGNERGIILNSASNNTITGNYVGTDVFGSAALPNEFEGIWLSGASQNNTIGGTADGAGNVVSGNHGDGLLLDGADVTDNTIQGNYVGTSADGTATLRNDVGISIEDGSQNVIGGSADGAGNVVAGNLTGIFLLGADENTIQGNHVGTNADGDAGLGNRTGIFVNGSHGNVVGGTGAGEANVIAYNTGSSGRGVAVVSGTRNSIRGNATYANDGLGIDLGATGMTPNDAGDSDTGANDLQNFPVITDAEYNPFADQVTVYFQVPSDPALSGSGASTYPLAIDFYKTDADMEEGAVYLGTTNYLASTYTGGPGTFYGFTPPAGVEIGQNDFIVATATDDEGNTSEFSAPASLGPTLFTVDDTGDAADFDTADDVCDTDDSAGDGPCTLRAAIEQANVTANLNAGMVTEVPDSITFALPGSASPAAPHVIQPASALPQVTDPVVVDGTSEPDFAGVPIIQLDGANAGSGVTGMDVRAGSSTIRGLALVGFDGDGIGLTTGDGNVVEGCYLGLEADGVTAAGNGSAGYFAGVDVGSDGNTIGGASAGARNVLSGNAMANGVRVTGDDNTVENNYVGLDPAGTAAVANFRGIQVSNGDGNILRDNVVSGNDTDGFSISGAGNTVQGNRIGVDVDGDPLGNGRHGVFFTAGAAGNAVGGTGAGEGNSIAHNASGGIVLFGGGSGAGSGNAVRGNGIYANGDQGIDLGSDGQTANDAGDADSGPNDLQNFPQIQSSNVDASNITVSFLVDTDPANATYPLAVDFYRAGTGGEGEVYLGTTSYTEDDFNGVGDATCITGPCVATATFAPQAAATTSDYVVATATDAGGNTSEFSSQSQLPVEFAAFEATRDGEAVRLAWQTASETNNQGFAVERRADEGAWTAVAFVEGAGTTTEAQSYSFTDEGVPFEAETVRYRLEQTDFDGTATYSSEVEVAPGPPEALALHGSFPNPFRLATTIRYELPEAAHVTLEVYDVLGRRVRMLVDGQQEAGRRAVKFEAGDLPSGTYFYRIEAGSFVQARSVVVAR